MDDLESVLKTLEESSDNKSIPIGNHLIWLMSEFRKIEEKEDKPLKEILFPYFAVYPKALKMVFDLRDLNKI